jgi:hypothetical protein
MSFLPVLAIIFLAVPVTLLLLLGRIGQRTNNQAPYASPVIYGEEVIPGCSGVHKADLRRSWSTPAKVYGPFTQKVNEIRTDTPIEVPNWPVRIERIK